jgi:hypothetical protein
MQLGVPSYAAAASGTAHHAGSTAKGFNRTHLIDMRAVKELSGRCRAAHGALHVAPLRGGALLFVSTDPDNVARPLADMWHGGCTVTRGEKRFITIFKKLPQKGWWPALRHAYDGVVSTAYTRVLQHFPKPDQRYQ